MGFFRLVVRNSTPVLLEASSKEEAIKAAEIDGKHVLLAVELINLESLLAQATIQEKSKPLKIWDDISKEEKHSINVVYNTLIKLSGYEKTSTAYQLASGLLEIFNISRQDLK